MANLSPEALAILKGQDPDQQDLPQDYVEPNGLPNSLIDQINSPERQKMLKDLQDKSQQAIEQQRSGIGQNEQALQALKDKGPDINFAPLTATVDSLTGSNLSAGAPKVETPQQYQEKLLTLQNAIQSQRQGLSQEQISMLKNQLSTMNPLALARLGQRDKTIGLAEDRAAAQAVKDIDNHPLIIQADQQLGFIQRDKHTIEGGAKITSQMLHELSNGIAAALGSGKSVGLGLSEQQDMSTAYTKAKQWESYLSNNPKEAASPQVRAQILDTLNRLEDAYSAYRQKMAQKLAAGRTYENNPQAQKAIKTTVGKYSYTPPTRSKVQTKNVPLSEGPDVNADLSKMTPEELKNYIDTHGAK